MSDVNTVLSNQVLVSLVGLFFWLVEWFVCWLICWLVGWTIWGLPCLFVSWFVSIVLVLFLLFRNSYNLSVFTSLPSTKSFLSFVFLKALLASLTSQNYGKTKSENCL